MTTTTVSTAARPDLRPVLWAAPLAGALSALVNLVLYFAFRADFDTVRVGPQQMAFSAPPVVLFSLVGAIGAGAVYALVARFARNPNRVFSIVAFVVLLLSFASPFSLQNPPATVFVALELMHVVVYGFVLWLVPRRR